MIKKLLCLLLIAFSGMLPGCKKAGQGIDKNKEGAVILKIPTYKVGENVGAKFFIPQVSRFNKAYQGQYEIVLEEVPQDSYYDKIKLLQQQKALPPLVERGDNQFLDNVIIKNNLYYDLKPWIDSKPQLKKLLIQDSVQYNMKNGKIFSLPYAFIRPIGLYYNKEMFEKAGISQDIARMSLSEFDRALADLKKAGFTPLALMTGENGWTTQLLMSAVFADQTGGMEILGKKQYQYDYTGLAWINTFKKIKKYFQEYTTNNAVGAVYADAANNFLNERAAIIANGPWMVNDFKDTSKTTAGFHAKVGSSIYPGGYAIAVVQDYHWWIPSGLPQAVTQGALAFMEFMYRPDELEAFITAEGGTAPGIETSAEYRDKLDPILLELNDSVSRDMKNIILRLGDVWPNQIDQIEFGKLLPKLVDNSLSPEEFARQLTLKVQKFKK